MAVELPEISTDVNEPLPVVDPSSDLVPYRMTRTDPGNQPVVTTGYGPRARRPIVPPGGGGVGAPDLTQLTSQAFEHLPVDQAIRAVEAATRFLGQRGYMKDLEGGANAAQAFAKWGPMLFRNATGIPEAIDRSIPTPITPYQQAQLQFRREQAAQSQAAATAKLSADEAKAKTPKLHFGQSGEIIQQAPDGTYKVLREATEKPEKGATVSVPLDPANPRGSKITGRADDPEVRAALKREQEALNPKPEPVQPGIVDRLKSAVGLGPASTPAPAAPNPASPFKEGATIRSKKDGKLYKVVNGQPVPVKE
jgi:hypothetical protein